MGRELREVRINLDSYETATKAFYKSLSITPLEKNTNAVRIALKDPVPVRGVELIHALVDRYNRINNKFRPRRWSLLMLACR